MASKFWKRAGKQLGGLLHPLGAARRARNSIAKKNKARASEHDLDLQQQNIAADVFRTETAPQAAQGLEEGLASGGVSESSQANYLRDLQKKAFARRETGIAAGYQHTANVGAIERGSKVENWISNLAGSVVSAGYGMLTTSYLTPMIQQANTTSPIFKTGQSQYGWDNT